MKNITLEKIVKFAIGIAGIAVLGWVLVELGNLVLYLVLALILSYVLDPIVNWLQRNKVPRTLAITLTLSAVILLFVYASTTVIPKVADQMVQLARQLDIQNIENIANQVETKLSDDYDFIPEGFLSDNLTQVLNSLFDFDQFSSVFGNIVGVFTDIFSAILVVPFAAFFFLKDGSKIRRDLLRLIPNKYFETSLTLIDKIEKRLGLYFRSVLLQSLLVAASSWTTLSIAGLDNSLSVGIAVGLANTIPYFGPIIGYILSIIISIIETGDFSLVLVCIVAILIVQMLDNIVFQPLLFSRSADMHPVAILFIILIGAEVAGILGMLVAIPLATVIRITIIQISWSFNNYQVFNQEPELIKNSSG
ncbi:MAG TPA: AI-2E family transporter [Balneola sp.]|jgi:predicted PurR-regulated permease PerM|nr:AI-2E family transporter [Bacteroidota bacterium]MAC04662.1 AI-2E family transporter [Balneola sp.]MAO76827.1 AI-2E family transporter [Balneola sp.]MBF64984.1 AI-2E family transporter [Balneola sp.]HAH50484.1 AI-2E family transporter [Balneola sp.]|tara:strand:+ start:3545 stop:4633 length:1089 start_codon:yes stop_codon:yes gene_type:complete